MGEPAANTTKTSRPRGRRAAAKVPCDDCIARASGNNDEGAVLELCEKCTAVLHRPRRKQQEQPSIKRVRRQSNAIIDTALAVHTEPVDLPWSHDSQEQHAIQFFIHHSAPQLAGYFDSPFWQRMVLQAGRHEPAVRHAIAAIGAVHEKLLTGAVAPDQSQDKQTSFALEQCNKSIEHLIKPPNPKAKPNLRLMLTTSVLFTCFGALQGHCEQAIVHATQGYTLLQEYAMDPENRRWDVGTFAVELDQLCVLMRRLRTQSKGLMGRDLNIGLDPQVINAKQPNEFSSLQEACSGLELVLNQLKVFFLDMDLDDQFYAHAVLSTSKHIFFSPWLAAWEQAFTSYLSQHQAFLNVEDRRKAMILKAHELVAEILSGVDLSLGEFGWDVFRDKFEAITNLASAVLESSQQADTCAIEPRWETSGGSISAPNMKMSFSLGIVDPLYEVCSRCRDPILRRRALDLLAKHPRKECVWSSWSAWKVGKFLMQLEEEGTVTPPSQSTDVPPERRISEASLDFSDDTSEQSGTGSAALKKAVPRYALNPGLFEDWHDSSIGVGQGVYTASARPGESTWGVQSTLAPAGSSFPAVAWNSELHEPIWLDLDRSNAPTNIPSILETAPQD